MPDELRHSQGPSRVVGSRLNPEIVKDLFAEEATIPDAIEGHPAGETEVFHSGDLSDMTGTANHHLLGHLLDRGGHLHEMRSDLGFRFAAFLPEEGFKLPGNHGEPGGIVEVRHVQAKRAVVLEVEKLVEN